jgi:hypothetical protein
MVLETGPGNIGIGLDDARGRMDPARGGVVTMKGRISIGIVLAAAAAVLAASGSALAHCDSLDGPVVQAARRALEEGDVNLVLIWVRPEDEAEIRRSFEQTVSLRSMGPEVKEMADRHFFETLVRVHRAGEGAPFTGLKPAGRDLGPAIPAADRALESGEIGPVIDLLLEATRHGIRERFERARTTARNETDGVAEGREHVAAYVDFVHYVEGLYEAASRPAGGHHPGESGGNEHSSH